MNILSLFLLLLIFFLLFYIFKKIGFLNENTNYSVHKNFGETNESPIIIGGTFFIIVIIFFFESHITTLKISLIAIYILGLLSDKNILESPKIRILIQAAILFFLVFVSKLSINNLENELLNNLLKFNLINLFFTVFCLAILVNGSNFIDGLNGLLSGYYLLIICSIFYLSFTNDDLIFIFQNEIKLIFLALIIFFIFNLFGKVYLGDGGSYLIATFVGFYLINFVLINKHLDISPYYVASLLWYPAFENLFSIFRRVLKSNKVSSPDNKHLHQLIFLYLKSKNLIKLNYLNTFSSLVILMFNLPIFIFSSQNIIHSQKLLIMILIYIILYTLIYNFVSKNLKINK